VATNSLVFRFLAQDLASKSFDKLGSKIGGLGKSIALATGGVAAGGVAALGAAFVQGVKDAASFEVLAKKTAAVIKSTGNTARISVSGVQGLAASLESLSGVDEELIINSQNVLATFTRVRNESGKGRDIFNQATTAALNMSVALGTDLQGATIQVGKALNDPIKGISALRRVGVSFTDQQKKQIETMVKAGDTMGAQKLILRELNTEFGGAAKAAGDTFTGKIARAKDALSDMARDIGTKALPKLGQLADWVTTTGIPRFQRLVDFVGELVPKIAAKFGEIKAAVEKALPDIDLSRLGRGFATQAKGWAGSIIGGVRVGLDGGDWSGLGKSVGTGIIRAIEGAGRFAANIAGKIGDLLGKIDWLALGLKIGKVAVPLLVGVALGLLNFDLFGLLKGLAQHWQEVLIGILALAFTPLKVIGAVAKILAKIPLVGPFLSWGLKAMKGFADRMVGAVWRFIDDVFVKTLFPGLRRFFIGLAKSFAQWVSLLPTRLGVAAIQLQQKAAAMMAGLRKAIVDRIGGVIAAIGNLIKRMLAPFARAAGWLVGRGVEFVRGLVSGISRVIGTVSSAAGRVISAVTSPFKKAGTWLYGAGKNVIQGFWDGLTFIWKKVTGWVSGIATWIKEHKGPISLDKRLLYPAGVALMTGFLKGLQSGAGAAWDFVKGVGGKTVAALRSVFAPIGRVASGTNVQIGQSLAAQLHGWVGAQWEALLRLWTGESGWNNLADNPTSTAFGIPQFIASTARQYGVLGSTSPVAQITAGMRYIQDVYGTPANAYAKWLSRSPHWYAHGGLITEPIWGVGRSGRSYMFGEAGDETVIPGRVRTGDVHHHYHVTVQTPGVVGMTMQDVDNHLVRTLDRLVRQRRVA